MSTSGNATPEIAGNPFWKDAVLLAVLVYGVIIRAVFLREPVRLDEFYTYFNYVIYPFRHILSTYDVPNNHVFHSILARIFYLLGGTSETVLRLPAFLAGCALIPAVYRLALSLGLSRNSARLAAFFTASSGGLIYYSVNARGYSLQALLAVLCTSVYLSRGRGRLPLSASALLCALTVLVLYTVPTGLVFVLPFFLFMFLDPEGLSRGRIAALGACCFLLTAVLYAPVLRQMAAAMHDTVGGPLLPVLGVAVSTLTPGVMPSLLLLLCAFAGLFYSPKNVVRQSFFFSLVLLPPIGVVVLALAFPSATLMPRSFLLLFPFAYLLAAAGMETILLRVFSGRWLRVSAAFFGLILLYGVWGDLGMVKDRSALFYPDRGMYDYYRRTVRKTLEGLSKDGNCILGTGAADSLAAFYASEKNPSLWCYSKYHNGLSSVVGVYILADDPGNLLNFCRRQVDPREWLPPEAVDKYGSAGLYLMRRRPGRKS